MSKASDLLRWVARNADYSIDEQLRQLPDEHFRAALIAVATLFSTLKQEAQRRGIWDDCTKTPGKTGGGHE